MSDKYRKLKYTGDMTPEERNTFKETEFDFDESLFGAFVVCDPNYYTELPENCKADTIPASFRNGDYRADSVCDSFMDELGYAWVLESELEAGICIEWPCKVKEE
jgi:hypothetical protein